jgi:hypothetical protein
MGTGLGFVGFAEATPALFRLMFATERKPNKSPS